MKKERNNLCKGEKNNNTASRSSGANVSDQSDSPGRCWWTLGRKKCWRQDNNHDDQIDKSMHFDRVWSNHLNCYRYSFARAAPKPMLENNETGDERRKKKERTEEAQTPFVLLFLLFVKMRFGFFSSHLGCCIMVIQMPKGRKLLTSILNK